MNHLPVGSLLTALVVVGLLGCATLDAPAVVTGEWLEGVWSGEGSRGWTYTLTVAADGAFSQVVRSAEGPPCAQAGSLWIRSGQLHTRFERNGCNEDFVGVTEAFSVRAMAHDVLVIERPGAQLRLRRAR